MDENKRDEENHKEEKPDIINDHQTETNTRKESDINIDILHTILLNIKRIQLEQEYIQKELVEIKKRQERRKIIHEKIQATEESKSNSQKLYNSDQNLAVKSEKSGTIPRQRSSEPILNLQEKISESKVYQDALDLLLADSLSAKANKHDCYEKSVQSVKQEVQTLFNLYKTYFPNRVPYILREDFCGTALLCREWHDFNVQNTALGVDIDDSVLKYCAERYPEKIESGRLTLYNQNVLDRNESIPKADILSALNYSLCYWRTKGQLTEYLKVCHDNLKIHGVAVFDLFGGYNVYKGGDLTCREFDEFLYVFEKRKYNFMIDRIECHMHFRFPDVWGIPDIYESLKEAGFKRISTWVSTSKMNEDGELISATPYEQITSDEESLKLNSTNWNVYIVASK
ncbi:hypothetical protein ROZALSC1DRAFT_30867 [Rozella allomycis CSF55]|uniref:Methyltransferase domain-containing protein n=1 Tax=Rozella allomycis (strain CSF55) TaxID=988480 RepID=A0A4P9YDQ4_ROZAC|nr:hypothetical protein ROZALSC1DRAFT_30867 [Rozella allomycis CSF55]